MDKKKRLLKIKRELPLHLMLLPGIVVVFIFHYIPLAGIVIAFQRFVPAKGLFGEQQWIGLGNFEYLFSLSNTFNVVKNTVTIAVSKIVLSLVITILTALLLNELTNLRFKKVVQTVIYFPHFVSWIILSPILIDLLSPSSGIINQLLGYFGLGPYFFLGDNRYFQGTMIVTDIWKGFGYGTIAYLASIASVDQNLYEAAAIDGAGRLRQAWHVTLPGMRGIIALKVLLSIGDIFNAGFDQIYNMYSPVVYKTGDVLSTMIYRMGLQGGQYGPAAAAGLAQALIQSLLVCVAYYLAYKLFDYKLF